MRKRHSDCAIALVCCDRKRRSLAAYRGEGVCGLQCGAPSERRRGDVAWGAGDESDGADVLVTIVVALLATAAAILILNNAPVSERLGAALLIVSEQSVLFAVLGAFLLFTRFRFADLFIRYSVEILLAGAFAVVGS